MDNLNRVILHGHLTRDPELHYTPTALAVCDFAIAVNRTRKGKDGEEDREDASYIDVQCWQKLAEVCAGYLKKGRGVLVDGKLVQERWEDEQNQKRSRLRVVAERVHFLGSAPGSGEGGKGGPPTKTAMSLPYPEKKP